jgi:hypothetical protein
MCYSYLHKVKCKVCAEKELGNVATIDYQTCAEPCDTPWTFKGGLNETEVEMDHCRVCMLEVDEDHHGVKSMKWSETRFHVEVVNGERFWEERGSYINTSTGCYFSIPDADLIPQAELPEEQAELLQQALIVCHIHDTESSSEEINDNNTKVCTCKEVEGEWVLIMPEEIACA